MLKRHLCILLFFFGISFKHFLFKKNNEIKKNLTIDMRSCDWKFEIISILNKFTSVTIFINNN